jgi:hypothetical protein
VLAVGKSAAGRLSLSRARARSVSNIDSGLKDPSHERCAGQREWNTIGRLASDVYPDYRHQPE